MSKTIQYLELLSKYHFISGAEQNEEKDLDFSGLFPSFEISRDLLGNFLFTKKSRNSNAKKILVEAHIDTIGFCVKEIVKGGFVALSPCGGFDRKILPGTEVMSVKNPNCKGIICSLPPHLAKSEEGEKKDENEIFADFGFLSVSNAEKNLEIGDIIAFSNPVLSLNNDKICAPGLDNKAGVCALMLAMEKVASDNDVYFLFSFGEETTSRGVISIAESINPDIAIVVDAGFSFAPGLEDSPCVKMDCGPSVSITDTLSIPLSNWVIDVAKSRNIPLQIVCEPGGTGTSGTKLQLQNGGIPCVVISFPLKNMHTPSEIVSKNDIVKTAELIVALVSENQIPELGGKVNG